jgi:ATP-dependent DNA helicase RecQ
VEESLAPEAAGRFERLRAVRAEIARARNLPPYCICHDVTLKQIASFAPSDVSALEQVKGMGPFKVKNYGEAFLAAVRG